MEERVRHSGISTEHHAEVFQTYPMEQITGHLMISVVVGKRDTNHVDKWQNREYQYASDGKEEQRDVESLIEQELNIVNKRRNLLALQIQRLKVSRTLDIAPPSPDKACGYHASQDTEEQEKHRVVTELIDWQQLPGNLHPCCLNGTERYEIDQILESLIDHERNIRDFDKKESDTLDKLFME